MNAKMVITVPIESVPDKIQNIISECSDKLNDLSIKLEFCSRDISASADLLQQLETLDAIRKKLSLVDLNIEDCYTTLKGYINYQYSIQNKQESESNVTTEEQR